VTPGFEMLSYPEREFWGIEAFSPINPLMSDRLLAVCKANRM